MKRVGMLRRCHGAERTSPATKSGTIGRILGSPSAAAEPPTRQPRWGGGVALMGRIGIGELLIILAIVFVIFGARLVNRLPDVGKGIGSAIRNFKDEMKDGKS